MTILEAFRAIAPEFAAKTDEQVNIKIELAKPHVSASRFGSLYEQAVAYYAAHLFAIDVLVQTGGSTGAALIAGTLTGEREGDLQRQYAQYMNDKKPSPLDRTYYGQEFQVLAKKRVVPVLTRQG